MISRNPNDRIAQQAALAGGPGERLISFRLLPFPADRGKRRLRHMRTLAGMQRCLRFGRQDLYRSTHLMKGARSSGNTSLRLLDRRFTNTLEDSGSHSEQLIKPRSDLALPFSRRLRRYPGEGGKEVVNHPARIGLDFDRHGHAGGEGVHGKVVKIASAAIPEEEAKRALANAAAAA